jgi:hypothetical protein
MRSSPFSFTQEDAQRVRVMAVADAERMKSEALVLKENPC